MSLQEQGCHPCPPPRSITLTRIQTPLTKTCQLNYMYEYK